MKLPIAIQLYSVRDDMEKDFYGTVKKVKELGYEGVEFAGLFGKSGVEVKAICDEIGVVPVSAHVPYYDMLENPEAVLKDYKDMGCKYVVVPYLTEECRPGTDGWDATVKGIGKIGEAAKEMGMLLLYHNHDFEFLKIDGEYALDILYNTIPADILATEIDTCWVNVGGENPAEGAKQSIDSVEKRRKALIGRKYPPEVGAAISAAKKGRPNGLEGRTGQKSAKSGMVLQIDETTKDVIATYYGFNEASEATGYAKTPIYEAARGIRKRAYGFLWEYQKRGGEYVAV